jgi:hypothetical protein
MIIVYWRANSSGSYIVPLNTPLDQGSANGAGTRIAYDGTNIYLYGQSLFSEYRDLSGNNQNCGNGEVRILARIIA